MKPTLPDGSHVVQARLRASAVAAARVACGRKWQVPPPLKRKSHAGQVVIVIVLTARSDGLQRTPRIRFATHRNVLGSFLLCGARPWKEPAQACAT